jgi:precorrin-6A/cobalt-precorrin-6A reductase
MQAGAEHQPGGLLWLISGTGEGPLLARELLARGWRLQVQVVSAAATRAYPPSERLTFSVGALGDAEAIAATMVQAALAGQGPRWVVDATHPFAVRISAALAAACRRRGQPLLRLLRPTLPAAGAVLLPALEALAQQPLQGQGLLLAIGARQLGAAVRCSPGAIHHARILPSPAALAAAMAAGLAPGRVGVLRPGGGAAIERALCRRWRIAAVLCRRSGSPSEAHWHRLAAADGLRLLLLERPPEPEGVEGLGLAALLERLGHP